MYIPASTRQAYAEVDSFLNCLTLDEKNKIPLNLQAFFEREKDKKYQKEISKYIPINEQELKPETLAIIAMLNLKYWCEDEEEKERLRKIYVENGEKIKRGMKTSTFSNTTEIQEEMKLEEDVSKNIKLAEYLPKKTFWDRIKSFLFKNKDI